MSGTLTCQREPTWKKDENENTRGSVDFHHTLPIFHEVAKGWDHEVIEAEKTNLHRAPQFLSAALISTVTYIPVVFH